MIRWIRRLWIILLLGALAVVGFFVLPVEQESRRSLRESIDPVGTVGQTAQTPGPASSRAGNTAPESLWQPIDENSVAELPFYPDAVEDRALVRISDVSGGWRVGDEIEIIVPQLGTSYRPTVDEIKPGPGGIRSISGTLVSAAHGDLRFLITVGSKHTFGHLTTPAGSYELFATGDLGWLMPSANMDVDVDYSQPDNFTAEEMPDVFH